MNKSLCSLLFFFLLILFSSAQEKQKDTTAVDSVKTDLTKKGVVVKDVIVEKREEINPLAPSKAAFFSAILPGLGQIYNKRYWKVPLVYAAIGTGVYVYVVNDDFYDRFRTAFKRRKAGFIDDEFYDINQSGVVPGNPDLSDVALQDAQERYQRDRDLALVVTIGLYALNIIDANVDAHLRQFNVDDNLSMDFKPYLEYNPINANANYGMALTIKF
ncbi:DUF5683 domain-containing protein [Flavobacteriaceae bacterium KMM 6898]|nr:DUF5683 domain-containing protein [Flavobacteriaceae bacterium KMM 6898]